MTMRPRVYPVVVSFFFFREPATTKIYTLSLHDALPISDRAANQPAGPARILPWFERDNRDRSEEHTSELQSHVNLVCRLLLEKKKINLLGLICIESVFSLVPTDFLDFLELTQAYFASRI